MHLKNIFKYIEIQQTHLLLQIKQTFCVDQSQSAPI